MSSANRSALKKWLARGGFLVADACMGDKVFDEAFVKLCRELGLEVDPDKAWSEKEQVYKSSGLIIRTSNITQTARGRQGYWTTVVAMAMFLFEQGHKGK